MIKLDPSSVMSDKDFAPNLCHNVLEERWKLKSVVKELTDTTIMAQCNVDWS